MYTRPRDGGRKGEDRRGGGPTLPPADRGGGGGGGRGEGGGPAEAVGLRRVGGWGRDFEDLSDN